MTEPERPERYRTCVCKHPDHRPLSDECPVLDCGCTEYQPQPAGPQTLAVVQTVEICDACAPLIESTVRRLTAERDSWQRRAEQYYQRWQDEDQAEQQQLITLAADMEFVAARGAGLMPYVHRLRAIAGPEVRR